MGKFIQELEKMMAIYFFNCCAKIAGQSTCFRAKGGSVIVKNDKIIGQGYNSPPARMVLYHCFKDDLPPNFKSDSTCCVHAEQRAIIDALKRKSMDITGSRIYYARLDEKGKIKPADQPYCTICSKLALDVGISEFALWHEEGIKVYDTLEYNLLSYGLTEVPK